MKASRSDSTRADALVNCWLDLDALVAENGTRFTRWGKDFDITAAVAGHLDEDAWHSWFSRTPTTPRPPSPEEARVLGLD